MKPAAYWIQELNLQTHPEGGYFAETYRATETIPPEALPNRFSGGRVYGTAIYFLLESHHFSALHRIQSDEVWHFYSGISLNVYIIDNQGILKTIHLGSNPEKGEVFQTVVPAGCWFGAKLVVPESYSLVGCTVAPGFDFADFELAERASLLTEFPQHQAIIELLTSA